MGFLSIYSAAENALEGREAEQGTFKLAMA